MFSINKKYKIVNAYKVCKLEESVAFDFKKYSKELLVFFSNKAYGKVDHIEANYGYKTWKTLGGFNKGVEQFNNRNLTLLMASIDNNKVLIILSNSLMNSDNPPDKGLIDLKIAFQKKVYNETDVIDFINFFCDFDYYYVFESNRKNIYDETSRKSFFKKKKSNITNFRFYGLGINEGYIKKLYPFNVLNKSQLEQPIIKSLIGREVGITERLNDRLTIWRLSKEEFEIANKELNNSKYVIYNEENPDLFLQTDDAKRFYEQMKTN